MAGNIVGRRQKIDNSDHYLIKPNLFFYVNTKYAFNHIKRKD
jgi:hypothetical protein